MKANPVVQFVTAMVPAARTVPDQGMKKTVYRETGPPDAARSANVQCKKNTPKVY